MSAADNNKWQPPVRPFPQDSYAHLKISIEEGSGVAKVLLNRPEKFNSMNMRMHYEAGRVWRDLDLDDRVRVIVVTGEGSAFSAGGDIELTLGMAQDPELRRRVFEDARMIVREMIECRKPIISAVNGAAVGAGMAVAVMADIVIASDTAKFGDGHTNIGVAAGDHACAIWPLAMGISKAKYYLLTGDLLTATVAEKLGLVTEVVAKERVVARAMEIANILSQKPQHAIRDTKFALKQWLRQSSITSMDASMGFEMLNFSEPDAKEGLKAFAEKRKPRFPSAL
jgi:enoyl-CoA hydratase